MPDFALLIRVGSVRPFKGFTLFCTSSFLCLIAYECQESEERAIRFEAHQDPAVIAHGCLVVECHVLPHCMEVAPKPLYRFAFKNGAGPGEVDEVVHHFAGAPRNIRPACKRPDASYQIQASLTSTDFH